MNYLHKEQKESTFPLKSLLCDLPQFLFLFYDSFLIIPITVSLFPHMAIIKTATSVAKGE
jgi:hypothetical protein